MTQFHYLDDSGDPGLSGAKGSSSYFVLAMVQLAEHAPLPQLEHLRRQFHFDPTFEFKLYKTKERHRLAFFETIRTIPFRVRSVVVDKSRLGEEFTRLSGEQLTIKFIARLVMRISELDLANDTLIVDGTVPVFRHKLRVRLSQECRRLGRPRLFGKIIGGDSNREDGLQVADMIVGAIRLHATGVRSDYYETLASKVVELWHVPELEK